MTDLNDTEVFRQQVVEIIQRFRAQEDNIRAQYEQAVEGAPPTIVEEPKYLLERATRRFLIDRFLSALDWSPDDARVVSEEARAVAQDGGRLYFDYLGLAPQTPFPVLIVEGKAFDLPVPGSSGSDSREIVRLVVDELEAVKRGKTTGKVTGQWTKWLRDMTEYVAALSGQTTLSRVVLTAGQWFVVFRDPISAFGDRRVRPDDVFCFAGFDEIVGRHVELFGLLSRSRVVDTLPLALDVGQALQMIRPNTVQECFRAVAVATTTSGASRRPYPTRSVYAAIVVRAVNRFFAIVDWDQSVEEPRGPQGAGDYAGFFAEVERRVDALLKRVAASLGVAALKVSTLDEFPGFSKSEARTNQWDFLPPVTGSTAHSRQVSSPGRRLVVPISEGLKGGQEYLIVTGTASFYKATSPSGGECGFHFWKTARADGKAAQLPVLQPTARSFTEDGQERHCAHDDLRTVRESRCQLVVLEIHMCCRACIFYSECWKDESHRLPCPSDTQTS